VSIKADISEMTSKDIEKLVSKTESIYGVIDTVICCAAISKPKLFLNTDFKEYEHHMNLNFLGCA
jgi:short-subunit dehydrogenase